MAEGLPVFFRRYGEGAVANYDWVDLAEGTGTIVLYGCMTRNTAGTDYILTASTPFTTASSLAYGTEIEVSGGTTYSVDFDLSPFNLPRNIKGIPYLNITWAQKGTASKNFVYSNLIHYDGTTETTLASVSGGWADTDSGNARTDLLVFPAVATKHFKKGDTLRLEIGFVGQGTNSNIFVADPQNGDGIWIKPSTNARSSKLMFYCPFQIDI